jgi:hypothetical protein
MDRSYAPDNADGGDQRRPYMTCDLWLLPRKAAGATL